jgi:hypothetical protein
LQCEGEDYLRRRILELEEYLADEQEAHQTHCDPRIKELEDALRPFAELWEEAVRDGYPTYVGDRTSSTYCETAASVLGGSSPESTESAAEQSQ